MTETDLKNEFFECQDEMEKNTIMKAAFEDVCKKRGISKLSWMLENSNRKHKI